MEYTRKQILVEAFQVTEPLQANELKNFFSEFGYELISITQLLKQSFGRKPQIKLTIVDLKDTKQELIFCAGDYICKQGDCFLIRNESIFKRDFEPVEPILENLAFQLNQFA